MGDEAQDTEVDALLGRVIAGKLELVELLGSGAMGKVYRAHHQALDKDVAIKVLRQVDGDKQRARRFKAEARAASRLEHPNSVQILDFGEDTKDGLLYIAMEYLSGEDLQSVCRREGALSADRALPIMIQVLGALGAAHDGGVIHRDMKPGNVMLITKSGDDGLVNDFVKVCDFGLAKVLDLGDEESSGPLTKQGAIFGTPAYMSPEQARGEPLDARTDLYSCGVILYKMLSGRTPFHAESAWGILNKHMSEPPTLVTELVAGLDPGLATIIHRALAKSRDERFQTARELRDALRSAAHRLGLYVPSYSQLSQVGLRQLPTEEASAELRTTQDRAPTPLTRPDLAPKSTHHAPVASMTLPTATQLGMDTVAGRTRTPSELARTEMNAAPLQTIEPAPSGKLVVPAPRINPLLVAVPGSLALLAVGMLAVFVILRPPVTKPTAASAAPPVANAPAPRAPPEAPDPTRDPAAPAKRLPTQPAALGDDSREEETAPSQRPGLRRKRKTPEPEATPPPPVAAPDPPARPSESQKPAVPEPATPKPEIPPPAAAVPSKVDVAELPRSFRLESTITELTVGGGMSKNHTERALVRVLPQMQSCLRDVVAKGRVHTEGVQDVTAAVDDRGMINRVASSGPLLGVTTCLQDVLGKARLPPPDTGQTTLHLKLGYRTLP